MGRGPGKTGWQRLSPLVQVPDSAHRNFKTDIYMCLKQKTTQPTFEIDKGKCSEMTQQMSTKW